VTNHDLKPDKLPTSVYLLSVLTFSAVHFTMASTENQAPTEPPTEQLQNLVLDEVTGEQISKTERGYRCEALFEFWIQLLTGLCSQAS